MPGLALTVYEVVREFRLKLSTLLSVSVTRYKRELVSISSYKLHLGSETTYKRQILDLSGGLSLGSTPKDDLKYLFYFTHFPDYKIHPFYQEFIDKIKSCSLTLKSQIVCFYNSFCNLQTALTCSVTNTNELLRHFDNILEKITSTNTNMLQTILNFEQKILDFSKKILQGVETLSKTIQQISKNTNKLYQTILEKIQSNKGRLSETIKKIEQGIGEIVSSLKSYVNSEMEKNKTSLQKQKSTLAQSQIPGEISTNIRQLNRLLSLIPGRLAIAKNKYEIISGSSKCKGKFLINLIRQDFTKFPEVKNVNIETITVDKIKEALEEFKGNITLEGIKRINQKLKTSFKTERTHYLNINRIKKFLKDILRLHLSTLSTDDAIRDLNKLLKIQFSSRNRDVENDVKLVLQEYKERKADEERKEKDKQYLEILEKYEKVDASQLNVQEVRNEIIKLGKSIAAGPNPVSFKNFISRIIKGLKERYGECKFEEALGKIEGISITKQDVEKIQRSLNGMSYIKDLKAQFTDPSKFPSLVDLENKDANSLDEKITIIEEYSTSLETGYINLLKGHKQYFEKDFHKEFANIKGQLEKLDDLHKLQKDPEYSAFLKRYTSVMSGITTLVKYKNEIGEKKSKIQQEINTLLQQITTVKSELDQVKQKLETLKHIKSKEKELQVVKDAIAPFNHVDTDTVTDTDDETGQLQGFISTISGLISDDKIKDIPATTQGASLSSVGGTKTVEPKLREVVGDLEKVGPYREIIKNMEAVENQLTRFNNEDKAALKDIDQTSIDSLSKHLNKIKQAVSGYLTRYDGSTNGQTTSGPSSGLSSIPSEVSSSAKEDFEKLTRDVEQVTSHITNYNKTKKEIEQNDEITKMYKNGLLLLILFRMELRRFRQRVEYSKYVINKKKDSLLMFQTSLCSLKSTFNKIYCTSSRLDNLSLMIPNLRTLKCLMGEVAKCLYWGHSLRIPKLTQENLGIPSLDSLKTNLNNLSQKLKDYPGDESIADSGKHSSPGVQVNSPIQGTGTGGDEVGKEIEEIKKQITRLNLDKDLIQPVGEQISSIKDVIQKLTSDDTQIESESKVLITRFGIVESSLAGLERCLDFFVVSFVKSTTQSMLCNTRELAVKLQLCQNFWSSNLDRDLMPNLEAQSLHSLTENLQEYLFLIFSHIIMVESMLVVSRLYEYCLISKEVLNKIKRVNKCNCVINFKYDKKDYLYSMFFYLYDPKSIDKHKFYKDYNTSHNNYLCICLFIKYRLYPNLVMCLSYLTDVDIEISSSVKRTMNRQNNNKYSKETTKLIMFGIKAFFKFTNYLSSTDSKDNNCYCKSYEDPNYQYLISLIITVSNLVENIFGPHCYNPQTSIQHLCNLASELSFVDCDPLKPRTKPTPSEDTKSSSTGKPSLTSEPAVSTGTPKVTKSCGNCVSMCLICINFKVISKITDLATKKFYWLSYVPFELTQKVEFKTNGKGINGQKHLSFTYHLPVPVLNRTTVSYYKMVGALISKLRFTQCQQKVMLQFLSSLSFYLVQNESILKGTKRYIGNLTESLSKTYLGQTQNKDIATQIIDSHTIEQAMNSCTTSMNCNICVNGQLTVLFLNSCAQMFNSFKSPNSGPNSTEQKDLKEKCECGLCCIICLESDNIVKYTQNILATLKANTKGEEQSTGKSSCPNQSTQPMPTKETAEQKGKLKVRSSISTETTPGINTSTTLMTAVEKANSLVCDCNKVYECIRQLSKPKDQQNCSTSSGESASSKSVRSPNTDCVLSTHSKGVGSLACPPTKGASDQETIYEKFILDNLKAYLHSEINKLGSGSPTSSDASNLKCYNVCLRMSVLVKLLYCLISQIGTKEIIDILHGYSKTENDNQVPTLLLRINLMYDSNRVKLSKTHRMCELTGISGYNTGSNSVSNSGTKSSSSSSNYDSNYSYKSGSKRGSSSKSGNRSGSNYSGDSDSKIGSNYSSRSVGNYSSYSGTKSGYNSSKVGSKGGSKSGINYTNYGHHGSVEHAGLTHRYFGYDNLARPGVCFGIGQFKYILTRYVGIILMLKGR